MFTSIILFSMGEGFYPQLATAQEYKAKGYWNFDVIGPSVGLPLPLPSRLPLLLEIHELKGVIGYGPFLVGSGVGEAKIFSFGEAGVGFVSFFPLYFYLIPYAKIEKGKFLDMIDCFSLSKAFYLYGEGSAWASTIEFEPLPARYFDCGLGFNFYNLDFRLGFITESEVDKWEGKTYSSTTFYASIGSSAWGAYGVKKVSE